MPQLPSGQVETRQFPVVGEMQPRVMRPGEDWRIRVEGEIESPLTLSLPRLLAMPQRDFTMDVHCVTGWTRFNTTFTGIPLADLLYRARPNQRARFVQFVAYSDRNHDTSLPLDIALQDCWLVHQASHEPLTAEHGGPLRVVTRGRYFYKSLKWLHRIIVLADDTPGYWERESAYHNNADPFLEERYDASRLATREETDHFRQRTNFDDYRYGHRILIQANLANWSPQSKDLRGVQLKACNFDGANLRGVDFRGANLTLCKFFRADLSCVDFTGADLEGADFSGASSLADARFIDASLAAAKFFATKHDGTIRGPKDIPGLTLYGCRGLLEEQAQYLAERGIVPLP
jgi:DMSO/TMAO reductase YedYZ molybdopterin-dependent catalytic subunit